VRVAQEARLLADAQGATDWVAQLDTWLKQNHRRAPRR
jgi:hypothetical protein